MFNLSLHVNIDKRKVNGLADFFQVIYDLLQVPKSALWNVNNCCGGEVKDIWKILYLLAFWVKILHIYLYWSWERG